MYLLRPDSQTHFQSIWLRHPYNSQALSLKVKRQSQREGFAAQLCLKKVCAAPVPSMDLDPRISRNHTARI